MVLMFTQNFRAIQNYVNVYYPNLAIKRKRADFDFFGYIVKANYRKFR